MCARVAARVTWYSVLGGTVCNAIKCNAVCVYYGIVGCVIWLLEWWLCWYNCIN